MVSSNALPSACPGVGEALRDAGGHALRLLLLNAGPDRESAGLSASEFVTAVTAALSRYGELPLRAHEVVDVFFGGDCVCVWCRVCVQGYELSLYLCVVGIPTFSLFVALGVG
jgi:hypothetical protein